MLAAQQYFIENGSELCEESLQAQLLACIPAALRTTDDALTQWRMAVMQLHRRHFSGKGPKPPPTPYRVRLDIVQFAVTRCAFGFGFKNGRILKVAAGRLRSAAAIGNWRRKNAQIDQNADRSPLSSNWLRVAIKRKRAHVGRDQT